MASIATLTRAQLGREAQACGGDTTNDSQGNHTFFKYFAEMKGHQPRGWYVFFESSQVEQCGPFASLDLAKGHATQRMSGAARGPSSGFGAKRPRGAEDDATRTKATDATTGGGGGGGSGSGNGGGGSTVAGPSSIQLEVAHILLAMRSGSVAEVNGSTFPAEHEDLLSSWAMAAPAVFASFLAYEPEEITMQELLELIGQSGDSDDLMDAVYFGSSPPPRTSNAEGEKETVSASSDIAPGMTALEETGDNPYGMSATMLKLCSENIL